MGVFRKVGRGVGWAVKPMFNFKSWLGLSTIAGGFSAISRLAKGLVRQEKATHQETFDEALKRLNLQESDLQARAKEFLTLTCIYLVIGIAILSYAVYLFFWGGTPAGGMLAVGVAGLAFFYAFRYHFWFFQVKHRKLGCTLREWFNSTVEGK